MTARGATGLLLLPGLGFLIVFFGFPLVFAAAMSFGLINIGGAAKGLTLGHYGELFANSIYRESLVFSLYLSVVPVIVSLIFALPLAFALNLAFPAKGLFAALYKIPLIVPTIVAAFIVMVLLDRGGMASRALQPMGLGLPKLVRDDWALGAIAALAWKAIPFMTLIIAGAFAAVPRDMREAARTLGAAPRHVFFFVDLPLALPGITAAALLVFAGNTGAFAIPSLLGPIYPQPLSIHMYDNAYVQLNWGLVAAMGTMLSVLSGAVVLAYYALTSGLRQAYGGEVR